MPVRGHDFDSLQPDWPDAAGPGALPVNEYGDLTGCVLRGELPCAYEAGGRRRDGVVHFALDLRERAPSRDLDNLRLSITIDGTEHAADGGWFEDCLADIAAALPAETRLTNCFTCLYSDYFPAGHPMTGMSCHRDAKPEYLAVRSKHDYWSVPVTEFVPETHLCDDYQRRVPGTGYRG